MNKRSFERIRHSGYCAVSQPPTGDADLYKGRASCDKQRPPGVAAAYVDRRAALKLSCAQLLWIVQVGGQVLQARGPAVEKLLCLLQAVRLGTPVLHSRAPPNDCRVFGHSVVRPYGFLLDGNVAYRQTAHAIRDLAQAYDANVVFDRPVILRVHEDLRRLYCLGAGKEVKADARMPAHADENAGHAIAAVRSAQYVNIADQRRRAKPVVGIGNRTVESSRERV